MFLSSPTAILRNVLRIAIPLSVVLTVYIYLYPVFSSCGFPLPPTADGVAGSPSDAFWETVKLHLPLPKPSQNETFPAGASETSVGSESTSASSEDVTASDSADSSDSSDSSASLESSHVRIVPRLRNAPFRLLALGDPQLEGDTSIPNTYTESPFPHVVRVFRDATFQTDHYSLRWRIRQIAHDLIDIFFLDIPNNIESIRKRIDLFGNDFYLAHIYRTLHWWTKPTHVTVLGDLLGSQWLEDDEFDKRADRFWSRVVRGAERVPDEIARPPADEYELAGYLAAGDPRESLLEASNQTWSRRVINIAGNHDIGYAGDISEERIERFERRFGRANYELRFEIPLSSLSAEGARGVHDGETNPTSIKLVPELRVVVLNDMNLDTPANSTELQDATYAFINGVINTASAVEFLGHFTVVLTHVPLHKHDGVCVDAPLFDFHEHDGTLKEQNMLSADASRGFLEGILGMSGDTMAPANGRGRKGVILNGHDHAGCDTLHFINQTRGDSTVDRFWEVRRWEDAKREGTVGRAGHPGVREITVRSMMGDFGGNAGLLSAWFDEDSWEWRFEYAVCPLGTQHLWWLVHIMDFLVVVAVVAYPVVAVLESVYGPRLGLLRVRTVDDEKKKAKEKANGSVGPVASNAASAVAATANSKGGDMQRQQQQQQPKTEEDAVIHRNGSLSRSVTPSLRRNQSS